MDSHFQANSSIPLNEAQLRAILASESGRKLVLLLQKTDPTALREAARAADVELRVEVSTIVTEPWTSHRVTQGELA